MGTVTTRLQLALEDQLVRPYRTVPVDVRAGESLEVTLCYDRRAALVDLGCEGPAGWRGWSGGASNRFAITPHAATPGYVAGELEPGTWHVVLGLYRLPVEPLEVVVTATTGGSPAVEAEPAAPAPVAAVQGSARRLPSEPGLTWFAGDFHAHTVHSDGDRSIAGLARRAAANGLDVLAVTDHNTLSHHPLLAAAGAAYDITLLPGQEVTTDRGHANAFGDIGFVDFRRPAEEWVTQVAARGGLLSVNHPLEGDWAWQQPTSTLPPALELWHIGWFRDLAATAMWALWQRWRPDAVILGGSDFHNPSLGYEPGTPTTWVQAADRSPPGGPRRTRRRAHRDHPDTALPRPPAGGRRARRGGRRRDRAAGRARAGTAGHRGATALPAPGTRFVPARDGGARAGRRLSLRRCTA